MVISKIKYSELINHTQFNSMCARRNRNRIIREHELQILKYMTGVNRVQCGQSGQAGASGRGRRTQNEMQFNKWESETGVRARVPF